MENSRGNSILRILLHAFFLVSLNLFAIMIAFVIWQLTGQEPHKIIQATVALVINLVIYLIVFFVMRGIKADMMIIDNFMMMSILLVVSMALLPVFFYPMHYLTSGQESNFDQLMIAWPYQLVANGLCLVLNYFVLIRHDK